MGRGVKMDEGSEASAGVVCAAIGQSLMQPSPV